MKYLKNASLVLFTLCVVTSCRERAAQDVSPTTAAESESPPTAGQNTNAQRSASQNSTKGSPSVGIEQHDEAPAATPNDRDANAMTNQANQVGNVQTNHDNRDGNALANEDGIAQPNQANQAGDTQTNQSDLIGKVQANNENTDGNAQTNLANQDGSAQTNQANTDGNDYDPSTSSYAKRIRASQATVVHLRSKRQNSGSPSSLLGLNDQHALGSGVLVSSKGLVATLANFKNRAVPNNLEALYSDGTRAELTRIQGPSTNFIAFFQSERIQSTQHATLPTQASQAMVGDAMVAIGRPTQDGDIAASIAHLVSKNLHARPALDQKLFLLDSSQCQLTQGGGLFDAEGQLRAITYQHTSSQCAAIPIASQDIDEAEKLAPTMAPWLGMVVRSPKQDPNSTTTPVLGAEITSLTLNGPAQQSGLRVGDVITQVDGNSIDRITLLDYTSKLSVGQTVTIAARRREQLLNFELTPQHKPTETSSLIPPTD